MALGENIRNCRKKAGLTQKQLAEKIGKTLSSVQKYELGIAVPPLETIQKIADALHVTAGDLIETSMTLPLKEMASGDLGKLFEQFQRTVSYMEEDDARLLMIDLTNLLDYLCVVLKHIDHNEKTEIVSGVAGIIRGITNILSGHAQARNAIKTGKAEWLEFSMMSRFNVEDNINRIYSISKGQTNAAESEGAAHADDPEAR